MPVVYVNDNFGKWRSDFRSLLEHCLRDGVRGKPILCGVASESEADDRYALEHMAKVLKADTASSAGIDFSEYVSQ